MKIETVTMPFMSWVQIPDNPVQRDTIVHAKKAVKNHLRNDSITHLRVSAAVCKNNGWFKLDGHTRTHLWETGFLTKPDTVYVDVYHVDTINDVIELYKQFDNSNAAENAKDKISGFFNSFNFKPQSTLIRSSGLTSAIKILIGAYSNQIDIYKEGKKFIEEIKIIDKYNLSNCVFTSGVLAAMLLVVKVYGEDAMKFFVLVHNNEGSKVGKLKDSIQAARDVYDQYRLQKKTSGGDNMKTLCQKTLSCFEHWRNDKLFDTSILGSSIKGLDLNIYMKSKKINFKDIP